MHNANDHQSTIPRETVIRSYWSEEDDAWLAEVVGVSGTLTHADTEVEARRQALELADEWAEIEREAESLTLSEFSRWMDLDRKQTAGISAAVPDPDTNRSLAEWNRLLRSILKK